MRDKTVWALVPLKKLDQAKSRLSTLLSANERRGLAIAMLNDVLNTLCKTPELSGVLLVSRNPEIQSLLPLHPMLGFWEEPANCDLSESITEASSYLRDKFNAQGVMFVPADVPLITVSDVSLLLKQHKRLTLVPDGQKMGTNCLISSPPNSMPIRFDGRSFGPHLATATMLKLEPQVIQSARFSLDVDTPEDITELVYQMGECYTASFLETSGITTRLLGESTKSQIG